MDPRPLVEAASRVCDVATASLVGVRVSVDAPSKETAVDELAHSALGEQWCFVTDAARSLTCGKISRAYDIARSSGRRLCVLYTPRRPVDDDTVRFFDSRAQYYNYAIPCERCPDGALDAPVECVHVFDEPL